MQNIEVASPPKVKLENLRKYYQNRQLDEAEKLAISLTSEFPKHQFGWLILGALFAQSGRDSEALNANQIAVSLSPKNARAYSNLGVSLKKLGRLDEAKVSFLQAIDLKPDYAQAYNNLGNTFRALGKFEQAKISYKKAIKLKPDFAQAHSNLGNTFRALGKLEQAEISYKKAIKLKPANAEAYYNLGNTLKHLGRLGETESCLRQAIVLKPEYSEAHNNLGVMLSELGRSLEAETSFTKAITLKPDFAEAHNNLGNLLKSVGKLDEAITSFKKATALKPEYAEAKHMLSALLGQTTATAPPEYVESVFDNYATRFERNLVDKLEYKIPKAITQMIIKDSGSDSLGSIMDLGCGTGLLGIEIKNFCVNLEGVDLSKNMLDKAREKNVYDKLIKQDILTYLSTQTLNFDYFISADVFIYVGDLFDVFRLIKSRNNKSGKLVFSTEHRDGDKFFLEQSGRYSHSKNYIDNLCKTFGYEVRHFETQNLRKEKNQFINGGLYILEF